MPEKTSEDNEGNRTLEEVHELVRELSQDELQKLLNDLYLSTEYEEAGFRIVPYLVQGSLSPRLAGQSTQGRRRRNPELPDWPGIPDDWPSLPPIEWPDPGEEPIGPIVGPGLPPNPGWPTPPKPIPIPDEDEIGEEEEQLNLLSGGSPRTAASRVQSIGQPTISVKMTADLREENSGGEIPVRDVDLDINVSEGFEDRTIERLGDMQRVAMEGVKAWMRSSGDGHESGDGHVEIEQKFGADEVNIEITLH